MTPVPRIGRILDLVGLLLLLAGSGFVVRAWMGFREVQEYAPSSNDPPMAAVQLADTFWRLEKLGIALIVLGVAVFVGAWWVARSRKLGPEPPAALPPVA